MNQAAPSANSDPLLKRCNDCKGWFEKSRFPSGRARCKKCHAKRQAVSYRKSRLKHGYHITTEIYEAIRKDQASRCYFCDVPKEGGWYDGLVVDHDKDTGFVRGLLCHTCNANWIDEYKKLPKEYQDSQRANDYLRRGETGEYIERIKRLMAAEEQAVTP